MTYHSKSSSIKTNLWNSLYILWKSEIINRKKPLRYFKNPNIVYSEPHTSYNSLFVTQHQYLWYILQERNSYIQTKERKKFLLHLRILPKEASFHLQTKYKCLCECSQTFLHLENYRHQQAVALFLVNCIASILPLCKFSSQFLECFFWSSLKTIQSF